VRKRVSVRYGTTTEVRSLGFTLNASFRGLAISATNILPAGTRLHLELKLPGDRFCRATGTIAWSVRGMLALQIPGSMGIKVETADESFFQLLADNTPDEPAQTKPPNKASPTTSTAPRSSTGPSTSGASSSSTRTPSLSSSQRTTPSTGSPRVPGATFSGMQSTPKPKSGPVAAPPPPKKPFRFPRLVETMAIRFGTIGGAGTSGPVRVAGLTPLTAEGTTTNVSRSGIALSCKTPLKPGDEVRFTLTLPDQKICEGRGSVIWTRIEKVNGVDQPQMGIHIARIDQAYKDHLQWLARREGVAV
jgi:hypothetical protein